MASELPTSNERDIPEQVVEWCRATSALRWYDRTHMGHFIATGDSIRVKTLQQWWERVDGLGGEWREIKLEIGE